MATIYHLPQELLQHIVAAACDDPELITATVGDTAKSGLKQESSCTVKSLSTTNGLLRNLALPHLWQNAHISVAFNKMLESFSCVESFILPSHPIRQHARTLNINIDSQTVSLNPDLLTTSDAQLAQAIAGMTGVHSAQLHLWTMFEFPQSMQAVLELPDLSTLVLASRGRLNIPAIRADRLAVLSIHCDDGSCQLDLSCFTSLKELSLSMEDSPVSQSWEELRFPSHIWSTLKSLSMRGFALEPERPLARLAESLHSYQGTNSLTSISYHLAQDEQDATSAWQMMSQHTQLTSLSFTVPLLFDARYARRMIRAFPLLQTLELFTFSRAAAWQWPDPFDAYISGFSELKNLQVLSLNHNEMSTASPLPPTLTQDSIPMDASLPPSSMSQSIDTSPTLERIV